MKLSNLLSRQAVLEAIAEHDQLGAAAFLDKYNFKTARTYFLVHSDRRYDSKAIVGAAHGFQHPHLGPLLASQFSGGEATVARLLERLGFTVERLAETRSLPVLETGRVYKWEELAALFGFKEAYLGAAGGMVPRPEHDAVLLITHPGGGRSFDYEDYWEGEDLIYTGRGKKGDQVLEGANADVADNRRRLLVFENSGPKSLRFRGQATCDRHWLARGEDATGAERLIYRFRLKFDGTPRGSTSAAIPEESRKPARAPHRRSRPFDPTRPIASPTSRAARVSPEETLVEMEKAVVGHQQILVTLHQFLVEKGWQAIEEVPAAIDLWAVRPDGRRVIFEAKTIADANDCHQCRAGFAQLLEYRFFYGSPTDELCLVVDRPIGDARIRFLESAGVGIASVDEGRLCSVGMRAERTLGTT